ncbi:MFS transporter [Yinghuangia seranimata]|uniref:MFS transporter n=1 Tax=Yinghuangia seranimata TaxID=408067 RepID=UPI00248CBB77|nr:MFS transporter [Yinghuangia seranimata]MDI2126554.1 MFS transporter [Yinghuangia seranimata]
MSTTASAPTETGSPGPDFLATRRGKLTLLLLCAVAFLDFIDASIVNIALPTIQDDLHLSNQSLQWVPSGYLLTYGGLMLLGGRAADLLGRRRVLIAGTSVFAASSLVGGLATTSGVLIGARLAMGVGASMMLPAALSLLTTSFAEGGDRTKALGAWAGTGALASAVGVFLGGVLTAGPGWRWVMFVNLPVCALILPAIPRLLPNDRRRAPEREFDLLGTLLGTGGLLLLVFGLVKAPDQGWGSARTIAELGVSAAMLIAFVVNEAKVRNPLMPLSVFKVRGLGAANVTQLIAMSGFLSMFFFVTLYMQNVLHYSEIKAGAAFLPVCVGVAVTAGIVSALVPRTGTRPVIVVGALIASAGVYLLSRIPVDGSYATDLLPGLVVMSVGLGAVFVGVATAANAGVPANQAGLAAALLNTSQQIGGALGLAILSAVATSHTTHQMATGRPPAEAYTDGFARALLVGAVFLAAAALIAMRAANTRGEQPESADATPGRETSLVA